MSADHWAPFIKDEEHWLHIFEGSLQNVHPDDIKRWKGVLETLIKYGLQDVRVGEIIEKLESSV